MRARDTRHTQETPRAPKETMKIDNFLLRNIKLHNFQEKVKEFLENPPMEEAAPLTPSQILNNLEAHIVKCANKVASSEVEKQQPDWFSEAEHSLIDLRETRNLAFKTYMKQPNEGNHQKLKDARHNLLREKRRAKRQWQLTFIEKCRKSDFSQNPKDARAMIFKLMEGFQKHHKTEIPRNFKS